MAGLAVMAALMLPVIAPGVVMALRAKRRERDGRA